ncbi:MAG: nitroreductase family deazaflavin-dependent oxidoreductase [SAR202 cluster bacterium]|nr:nitroreductase family deazaflavin-dependent oxidoreductase [SAR202 cluster bacterium]MBM4406852.1 nitroreductase family deazaflavin-dependent oxidoreductase [Chloroflexota bacterium]
MRLLLKWFTFWHIFFYRLTRGRLGAHMGKYPMALVTTKGCKTGKWRTAPLGFMPDGERYVLIASYGGSPTHPAWYLNLVANPEAHVQFKGRKMRMRARTAVGEERSRLWALALTYYDYARYQRRTTREIPVVVLTPLAQ